jgi:hypothetical protein
MTNGCVKPVVTVSMLVLLGCGKSSRVQTTPAPAPSPSTNADSSQEVAPIHTPRITDSFAQQPLVGDVLINLNVTILPDQRARLSGTTNLPNGTKLMLSVEETLENGFLGQSSCVVSEGAFISESFGRTGGLTPGEYIADVTMPLPMVQPEAVKAVVGKNGENLRGPLVRQNSAGVTASRSMKFTVGGPSALRIQAERAEQIATETATLKKQVCEYLEQLLEFKNEPDFKRVGFAPGDRYHKWLSDVQRLHDAQPTGVHPIPLVVRAAPGDLIVLGLEYTRKGESDVSRQLLPQVKDAIGYSEYLMSKKRRLP